MGSMILNEYQKVPFLIVRIFLRAQAQVYFGTDVQNNRVVAYG